MKAGSRHTPEAKEKIRQKLIRHWQEPEFRARHLPHLLQIRKKGAEASIAVRRCVPPRGTPEYLQYEKVRKILGSEAARSILGVQP
jgi:hypothetical protein